jgi:hypothetical protein
MCCGCRRSNGLKGDGWSGICRYYRYHLVVLKMNLDYAVLLSWNGVLSFGAKLFAYNVATTLLIGVKEKPTNQVKLTWHFYKHCVVISGTFLIIPECELTSSWGLDEVTWVASSPNSPQLGTEMAWLRRSWQIEPLQMEQSLSLPWEYWAKISSSDRITC